MSSGNACNILKVCWYWEMHICLFLYADDELVHWEPNLFSLTIRNILWCNKAYESVCV